MADELKGKIAVITGGSRGLGYAIAQAYSAAGATVVIAGRSRSTLDKAVGSLLNAGGRASGLAVDVGSQEQVEALAEHAVQTFGRIDIWVNNAGIGAPYGPTVQVPPADFVQVVNTNILGTYYGSYAALRRFLAQGSGKLINLMGRGWKGDPVPWQNAYSSSKAWVHSFTLALAEETKQSGAKAVGIYAFSPGMVLTDMLTDIDVIEGSEEKLSRFPAIVRMWGKPAEVPAAKAVWIASAATDGKTGEIYDILTRSELLRGAVGEAGRKLFGGGKQAEAAPEIKMHTVSAQRAPNEFGAT
jgi:glucose 1-dehydrogenase